MSPGRNVSAVFTNMTGVTASKGKPINYKGL